MKYLFIILGFIFLTSCSSEPIQEASVSQVLASKTISIPAWLIGDYDGVHTQKELSIYPEKITFEYLDVYKEIHPSDVLQVVSETTRFLVYTTNDELIVFNKTTLDSEINVHFNALNLGWFRNKK
ncbi:MAG: hypothetical protein Q8K02_15030 [Flavobacterium sp.]|nr:hypothetical protein [Flavobacterium sp.]